MNMWEGKHICFLGDSITEGVAVAPQTTYWSILEKKAGIHAHGFGVNGARFRDLCAQIERMQNECGNGFDAVFIMAGTNDFNGNMPLGKWYTESEETVIAEKYGQGNPVRYEKRKKREFSFDTDTFCGSINAVLSRLKESCPDKQIVLLTPIHRAWAEFSPDNIQYNELYSNNLGLFLDSYVQAVREAANVWATELIDCHAVSGLFPLYDKSAALFFANLQSDRLHPGEKGHERLAQVIAAKLCTIPVFD